MTLLDRLEAAAESAMRGRPPAHDILHVRRVAAMAKRIAEAEGADVEIAVAAALLHELVNYAKHDPRSSRSGEDAAGAAERVLRECGATKIDAVCACIREHAFSKGVVPVTLEGKVVQDADRLDAIGAIGIARWAATCTEMGRPFYSAADPFCDAREPDDKSWGLDHFFRKLLKIREGLHTATAREMAASRAAFLEATVRQLREEI